MNTINFDDILREMSWRLETGIVDLTQPESINILRQIMIEMEYDRNFIDEYIFELKNVLLYKNVNTVIY
jgi:hypothetical protein